MGKVSIKATTGNHHNRRRNGKARLRDQKKKRQNERKFEEKNGKKTYKQHFRLVRKSSTDDSVRLHCMWGLGAFGRVMPALPDATEIPLHGLRKGRARGASKDLFCEFCIQYTVVVCVW